jgi:hypothetical protein
VIVNHADFAETHRVNTERPRAIIAVGYAWIGIALATAMRQYEAFMASARRALPERGRAELTPERWVVFLSVAGGGGETT